MKGLYNNLNNERVAQQDEVDLRNPILKQQGFHS